MNLIKPGQDQIIPPNDIDEKLAGRNVDDNIDDCISDEVGAALHSTLKVRGNLKNRLLSKGNSSYNDLKTDIVQATTESDLSVALCKWYSVKQCIDEHVQESLPGTYLCRYCRIDLEETHHPHEQAYRGSAELIAALPPPEMPCTYQVCGTQESSQQFLPFTQSFRRTKNVDSI